MNKRSFALRYALADFLAAFLAWMVFYLLRRHVEHFSEGYVFTLVGSAAVIAAFWTVLYTLWGFYTNIFRKSRLKEVFANLSASFVGVVLIFFALLLDQASADPQISYYRTFGTYFLLHFFITSFVKVLVMSRTVQLVRQRRIWFNTLIVGSARNALEMYQDVQDNYGALGFRFVGYVHVFNGQVADDNPLGEAVPHLGSYQKLEHLIRAHKVEQVIIAIEPSEHRRIEEILNLLDSSRLRISIIPDIYQILLGAVRVYHLFGTPLVDIKHELMPLWQRVAKRAFDVVVSLGVLTIGAPFYLAIALITKFTSEGGIIFQQERIGKDGQPFQIYKFRSMYTNAEAMGPALSSENDPRITPWGRFMRKTRIDETPQFFNVLKGDMSFVGPRPERQFYIDKIVEVAPHYRHLQKVRPGITSLGQVKYGYAENVAEMVRRLKYDILYIENMSLAMDARILLYTVLIIVQGRGK